MATRRIAARGSPLGQLEDFAQVKPLNQDAARHFAPIVEISGDDQRRLSGYQLLDMLFQCLQLLRLPTLEQPQVNTDAMQIFRPAGNARFRNEAGRGFRNDARKRLHCPSA